MLEYLRKADFVLAVISWVIINPPSVNRLCLHAQYCSCYVCWLQSDSGCIVGTFSHRESIRKIYYLINWHTVWWQKWAGMSKERLPHGCRHFRGFLQWWNWTWEIISKCALCMEVIIPQRVYKRALSVILSMSSAMDRRVLLVLFCLQAVLLFTAFTSTDAAAGLVRAQSPLRVRRWRTSCPSLMGLGFSQDRLREMVFSWYRQFWVPAQIKPVALSTSRTLMSSFSWCCKWREYVCPPEEGEDQQNSDGFPAAGGGPVDVHSLEESNHQRSLILKTNYLKCMTK